MAATIEAASPWLGGRFEARMAGGEIDVFWPSQLKRSLNPSSVESFLPSLSTVGTTYGRDLCSKGILGLSYTDVVAMLFRLFPCLLDLYFCFLCLIFELLGFFQLFLKSCHLFPGSSQLISGLVQALPLVLSLPLHAFQG